MRLVCITLGPHSVARYVQDSCSLIQYSAKVVVSSNLALKFDCQVRFMNGLLYIPLFLYEIKLVMALVTKYKW